MENFCTSEEMNEKMKWLPILMWVLSLVLGVALSIKIVLALTGISVI